MARCPRFYVGEGSLEEGVLSLAGQESRHVAGVLRLREGTAVELFDGQGRVGGASLLKVARDRVDVMVETVRQVPRITPSLCLATAIPKGKRWQMLVEKCTELGVGAIQPLHFEHSVATGSGDGRKWQRWAVEACKQSRRAWLPPIHPPLPLEDYLLRPVEGPCILASPEGESTLSWSTRFDRAREVAVVIGPEAGLTGEEAERCAHAGFAPVKFGAHILRIETAAMAACALVPGLSKEDRL